MNRTRNDLNTSTTPDPCRWVELVASIRSGCPSAMEDLYRILSRGVRYMFLRQLGSQDVDDQVHELLISVMNQIQRGDLKEPERLLGYVRTMAQRQVAACIEDRSRARRNFDIDTRSFSDGTPSPERTTIAHETEEIALRMLRSLKPRDREVLVRFYLDEEPQDQICEEMNLTLTQFRLIKSRAKARFGELGKARLQPRKPPTSWLSALQLPWRQTA